MNQKRSYLDKVNFAENGMSSVPSLPASIVALNMSSNPLQRNGLAYSIDYTVKSAKFM